MSEAMVHQAGPGMKPFLSRFTSLRDARSGEPDWLCARREEAMARFATVGFPTSKDEAWRATPVAFLARTDWQQTVGVESASSSSAPSGPAARRGHRPELDGAHRLVFVNGHLAPALSDCSRLPVGMVLTGMAEALRRTPEVVRDAFARLPDAGEQRFGDLNAALATEGAFVKLPAGKVIDEPIHLLFITDAAVGTDGAGKSLVTHPWSLLIAGAGCQASFVEEYAGEGDVSIFTNAVTSLVLEAGAVVEHLKIDSESRAASHIGLFQIHQERDSNLKAVSFALCGGLVRNDVHAVLHGEGATCSLFGLYAVDGRRHVDNHTRIDHAAPNCSSRELYKGILDGEGRGVFLGHVLVRPGAQKTSAWQTNQNLLLSAGARVESNPQLEIYADDVQCRHGSTVGQLDDNMLFYLRSRGIGAEAARQVLVRAFAGEILQQVRIPGLRESLEAAVFPPPANNTRSVT